MLRNGRHLRPGFYDLIEGGQGSWVSNSCRWDCFVAVGVGYFISRGFISPPDLQMLPIPPVTTTNSTTILKLLPSTTLVSILQRLQPADIGRLQLVNRSFRRLICANATKLPKPVAKELRFQRVEQSSSRGRVQKKSRREKNLIRVDKRGLAGARKTRLLAASSVESPLLCMVKRFSAVSELHFQSLPIDGALLAAACGLGGLNTLSFVFCHFNPVKRWASTFTPAPTSVPRGKGMELRIEFCRNVEEVLCDEVGGLNV